MSKSVSLYKSFAKKREGSVAVMLGLTFTLITGASLAAIEIEQAHRARAEMQQRLDATLLFLGGSEHKADPQAAGEAFLNSSVAATGLDVNNLTSTFEFDSATGNVRGSASFDADTLLSDSLLADTTITVESVATPKVTGRVEISMVLDTSGSMEFAFDSDTVTTKPHRRIDGLLEAASDMFDVIYQNPNVEPAVAVVPYAASVDITDVFAASPYKKNRFKPLGSGKLTDLAILPELGAEMPGNFGSNANITKLSKNKVKLRDHSQGQGVWAAERFVRKNSDGTYEISLDRPKTARPMPVVTQTQISNSCHSSYVAAFGSYCIDISKYNGMSGWYAYDHMKPTNGVLPLTLNANTVRTYVENLNAVGGTAGHIGAAWGAYMLTPEWNRMFKHPAGVPTNFDETTEKYLVFMTDGEFNSQKDANMSDDDMYSYFQSVCTTLRDKGVRIFTVGLIVAGEVDEETGAPVTTAAQQRTKDELSACAGKSGHYFTAENREGLINAFRSVGRAAGELRISH